MSSPQPRPDPGNDPEGRSADDNGLTSAERKRVRSAKAALRREILDKRARIELRAARMAALTIVDGAYRSTAVRRAQTIACYVAIGTEPGTGPLLERFLSEGKRVLLPVLRDDDDLDWAEFTGVECLGLGRHGLMEPTGERLGVDAIRDADVVLVPGLAVSRDGHRLGRGGGSYDRALARLRKKTYTAVVLFSDEVGVDVPLEPHDLPVKAAITMLQLHRMPLKGMR